MGRLRARARARTEEKARLGMRRRVDVIGGLSSSFAQSFEALSRLGSFVEIGQFFVTQELAISIGRFLDLPELFETLAAADIGFGDPRQKLLVADINALEISVCLRPLATFRGDLA